MTRRPLYTTCCLLLLLALAAALYWLIFVYIPRSSRSLADCIRAGDIDGIASRLEYIPIDSPIAKLSFPNNESKWLELTPLMLAAREGDLQTIQAILDAGADIDKTDEFDLSALGHAAWQGRTDVVDLLLRRGARHDVGTCKMATVPLLLAIASDSVLTVGRLLDAHAGIPPECHWRAIELVAASATFDVAFLEKMLVYFNVDVAIISPFNQGYVLNEARCSHRDPNEKVAILSKWGFRRE